MNVKKMAKKDAALWVDANKLRDVLIVKGQKIDGYNKVFDKEFMRLEKKIMPSHIRNIEKLQNSLDGKSSSKPSAKLLLLVAAGAGVYLLYNTEAGKSIRTKSHDKLVTWLNKPLTEEEETADAGA